jgi:hypothetical protein
MGGLLHFALGKRRRCLHHHTKFGLQINRERENEPAKQSRRNSRKSSSFAFIGVSLARKDKKSHAVVVLPGGAGGQAVRAMAPRHRRWLARSRPARADSATELLLQVLSALGQRSPEGGLAALRLWGQTGARPAGWIAAADPVWLEARLDHLFLHALSVAELPVADVREIFDHLQRTLADEGRCAFAAIETLGYLYCNQGMMTASASPLIAQGDSPGRFMPQGERAAAHDRLQSEVEMCLHESDVNERRARAGLRPINALWLWGGGAAPQPSTLALPPLYAGDPLFRGCWLSASAPVADWPADLDACLEASPDGFVAVTPAVGLTDEAALLDGYLRVLHRMLLKGRLRTMTLLFRDGLRADLRRSDMLRLWRRGLELPRPTSQ